jgi:hypothetical protein
VLAAVVAGATAVAHVTRVRREWTRCLAQGEELRAGVDDALKEGDYKRLHGLFYPMVRANIAEADFVVRLQAFEQKNGKLPGATGYWYESPSPVFPPRIGWQGGCGDGLLDADWIWDGEACWLTRFEIEHPSDPQMFGVARHLVMLKRWGGP